MKHSIIRGTLVLTLAGFLSRVLGFLYKIFLAHHMSPERLGLYQLLAPVYGICFTVYASGIQTAISGQVAAAMAQENAVKKARVVLFRGMLLSVSIALLLTLALYAFSAEIATHILSASDTADALRIVCRMFPFCAVTACCNGYFYGCRKAGVPAVAQLLEQISRILFVLICTGTVFTSLVLADSVSCELAVWGIVVGEMVSALCTLLLFFLTGKRSLSGEAATNDRPQDDLSLPSGESSFRPLLRLAVPLTANHLVLNLLHSYETILLPGLLMRNGLSYDNALGTLGVLTGMAMPFLFFPMALTSALSILLLPTIAEANARGNTYVMRTATQLTIRYTMLMGFLCTGLFFLLGPSLCQLVFRSAEAGIYLQVLAFFCPFLYMGQTVTSILNGLSKTAVTFRNSVISSSLRLALVAFLIPALGVRGFFIALATDILLSIVLSLTELRRSGLVCKDWSNALLKPFLATLLLLPFFYRVMEYTLHVTATHGLLRLFLLGFLYVICFLVVLMLLGVPVAQFMKDNDRS